jgi:hypothetical protein
MPDQSIAKDLRTLFHTLADRLAELESRLQRLELLDFDQSQEAHEAAMEMTIPEVREKLRELAKSVPTKTVTLEFSSEIPEGLSNVMQFADRVRVDGKLVKNRFGGLEEPKSQDPGKLLAIKDMISLNQLNDIRREALAVALAFGAERQDYHKAWVIDQMVRALAGDRYEEFVRLAKDGEDGPDTYDWEEGIAP